MSSIITFYSFKGGVGRTMALANIAVLLAKRGLKVLTVDWDLESPGLDRYFAAYDRLFIGEQDGGGLLDLLVEAQESSSPSDWPDWKKYVGTIVTPVGRLDTITTGRRNDHYAAKLETFHWSDFFDKHEGGEFFEGLRQAWLAQYDVTLIDSRTGFTDSGGVCTILMPDVLVAVFTANYQSLEGVRDAVKMAQDARQDLEYDRMPLLILPLPSRWDGRAEVNESQRWLDHFAHTIGHCYDAWLPSTYDPIQMIERTKVPHVAHFSFGERLPVLSHGTTDPDLPGYAYDAYATLIATDFKDAGRLIESPESDIGRLIESAKSLPAQPRHFRIFLSSPSDVVEERQIAREVIEMVLPHRPALRGKAVFTLMTGDDIYGNSLLTVGLTPQEAINRGLPKPSDCDLTIIIIWGRIGSPLPEEYRKPDGSRYMSRTEWEFEDAFRSDPNSVFIYQRSSPPLPHSGDPAEFREMAEQVERLNQFLAHLQNYDGFYTSSINTYGTSAEFRDKLIRHLEATVMVRLTEESVQSPVTTPPVPIKIIRQIDFPPEYSQAGISIMSYFAEVMRQKYAEIPATIQIRQEGLTFQMTVETIEGHREIIEQTLAEYGLVVSGQRQPAELFDDAVAIMRLENKLMMVEAELQYERRAYALLETQNKMAQLYGGQQARRIEHLETEVSELRQIIGSSLVGIQQVTNVDRHSTHLLSTGTVNNNQTLVDLFARHLERAPDSATLRQSIDTIRVLAERALTAIDQDTLSGSDKVALTQAAADIQAEDDMYWRAFKGELVDFFKNEGAGVGGNVTTEILQMLNVL